MYLVIQMTDQPSEEEKENFLVIEGGKIEAVVVRKAEPSEDTEEVVLASDVYSDHEDELAVWSTKYINSLPNSSFVIVEPCADENKNARHLPIKDDKGKLDLSHLQNALARANQIKAVCEGVSTDAIRAKAVSKLKPLAKKHFPNSKLSEDDPTQDEGSSESQNKSEGDTVTDKETNPDAEDKNKELSNATEELKSKFDELKQQYDEIKKNNDELAETIKEAEAKRQSEQLQKLAEEVFVKEVEIGSFEEKDRETRMAELVKISLDGLGSIMSTYDKIPKTEVGEGQPKATLSEGGSSDDEKTDEEKIAELREKLYGHKDAKTKVMSLGEDPTGNIRWVDIE